MQKVSVIGVDPASIPAEQFSPECLPSLEVLDLLSYLVLETSFYTNKQLKTFGSREAFNQMVSGFVTSVVSKVIAGKYVLKARVVKARIGASISGAVFFTQTYHFLRRAL